MRLTLLDKIGADPAASDDARLRRILLVRAASMIIVAGALWGLLYIAFGEPLAASIPFGYSLLSLASVGVFGLTRRFAFFLFSQLVLILLLPFLLMVALGGFINGSAVVFWSMLCPLGALLFDEPHRTPRWFLAYLGLLILSGLLQPFVRPANNLPPALIQIFFVLNIGTVCSLIFILLYSFLGEKNVAYLLLQSEQTRSENLLLNILPREIAAILKTENRTIADHFEGASILFADMVNFTPLSARLSPGELVDLLNEVFTYFDALVDKYQLEKIRTIGDSYMVASGVPRPRPDHAHALARLALEMQSYIHSHPSCVDRNLDFRIGINSGPVVAGVIGRKKFIYDLWGDAVNTASRMESHGVPGRIQITRETYELIQDEFECELRGVVSVKGKGEMETWYLVEPRERLAQARLAA